MYHVTTSANTGTATITSLSGSSEMFVLGNVATGGVSGSTITFTTPVGDVPFPMGGSLYKVSGSTLCNACLSLFHQLAETSKLPQVEV
jgi:hypothetical protein